MEERLDSKTPNPNSERDIVINEGNGNCTNNCLRNFSNELSDALSTWLSTEKSTPS